MPAVSLHPPFSDSFVPFPFPLFLYLLYQKFFYLSIMQFAQTYAGDFVQLFRARDIQREPAYLSHNHAPHSMRPQPPNHIIAKIKAAILFSFFCFLYCLNYCFYTTSTDIHIMICCINKKMLFFLKFICYTLFVLDRLSTNITYNLFYFQIFTSLSFTLLYHIGADLSTPIFHFCKGLFICECSLFIFDLICYSVSGKVSVICKRYVILFPLLSI